MILSHLLLQVVVMQLLLMIRTWFLMMNVVRQRIV